MDNEMMTTATEIIFHAGNARKLVSDSFDCAEAGDYTQASRKLQEAEGELDAAHQIQTGLIRREAAGEQTQMSFLMVHAQNTLMVAMSKSI